MVIFFFLLFINNIDQFFNKQTIFKKPNSAIYPKYKPRKSKLQRQCHLLQLPSIEK